MFRTIRRPAAEDGTRPQLHNAPLHGLQRREHHLQHPPLSVTQCRVCSCDYRPPQSLGKFTLHVPLQFFSCEMTIKINIKSASRGELGNGGIQWHTLGTHGYTLIIPFIYLLFFSTVPKHTHGEGRRLVSCSMSFDSAAIMSTLGPFLTLWLNLFGSYC